MNDALNDCELMDARRVAELVKVSAKTIQLWVNRGEFPAPLKPGGKLSRWSVAQIKAWVESDCGGGWENGSEAEEAAIALE